MLQCVAVCCNVLQRIAVCVAVCCNVCKIKEHTFKRATDRQWVVRQGTATHYGNTPQHTTAARRNTLLQHTVTHDCKRFFEKWLMWWEEEVVTCCSGVLQRVAVVCCSVLQ